MTTLLILDIASASLLIAISLPLLLRAVPPNPYYGFRLAPAFDSDRVWYAVNAYAAKWMIAAGACVLLTAIPLYFVPDLSIDVYALACLAALVIVLAPGVVLNLRYARRLADTPKQRDESPTG